MKEYKVFLVPHSHWDKEWYFTKEVSDIYLIDNFKNIIEANEQDANEAPFTWDAQYSVVDDFLHYYPEKKELLKKLISTKKLVIGPWYTQTDTFNATGESIVRNLLIGYKLSQQLGGSMNVAYLPDTFGFNSNLAQIVAKTNNIGIINWRGAEEHLLNNALFNLWEADDGTRYPLYNLYKHGYFSGVGGLLKQYNEQWNKESETVLWDPKTHAQTHAKVYLEWLQNELAILKPLAASTNKRILIPIGSDQMPMIHGWRLVVEQMNILDQTHEYILGDFETFMQDLINDKQVMAKANVIKGEMRYGKYTRAHKTITSSRYDIKFLSRSVENLLYKELEPLAVLYKQLGGEYPAEVILEITKKLVSSHAHDSLGGCNTDETNRSIIARLEATKSLIEGQITLIKKRIVQAIGLEKNELILFNLEPESCVMEFDIKIETIAKNFELYDENQKEIDLSIKNQIFFDNDNFKIVDQSSLLNYDGLTTKVQPNSGDLNATNLLLENITGRYSTEIYFKTQMPAFGYKVVKVVENQADQVLVSDLQNSIENERFKLTVSDNKISFFDKQLKITIDDLINFETTIDDGDTYDYSPPKDKIQNINELKLLTFKRLTNHQIQSLILEYTFKFNAKNKKYDNYEQKLTLHLILKENIIETEIYMNNVLQDVRWRIIYNSSVKDSLYSYADQSFAIVKRPVKNPMMEISKQEDWIDTPIELEANESLVYLKAKDYVVAIFTKGTNEYQIIGQNYEKIAITLFRGVSLIGRRNLLYRNGRASGIDDYPHRTPDSNLNKTMVFKLGLMFSQDANKLNKLSKRFNSDSVYYQKQTVNQFLWKGDTFVLSKRAPLKKLPKSISLGSIENIADLVVTAIKDTFDQKNSIIRLYNPTDKLVKINSNVLQDEINLVEENITKPNYSLKPNEVKTFILNLKKG